MDGNVSFSVVVLAAGVSNQLSPFLGRSLVEHAARTALASGAGEVIVVVGHNAGEVRKRLARLPVRIVHNRDWTSGMASSIRAGISAIAADCEAAVISLCDQPRVTGAHLNALADGAMSSAPVCASSYEGVIGAPCAFARSMFPELLALRGEAGARQLIRRPGVECATIEFAYANVEAPKAPPHRPVLGEPSLGILIHRGLGTTDSRAPPIATSHLIVA